MKPKSTLTPELAPQLAAKPTPTPEPAPAPQSEAKPTPTPQSEAKPTPPPTSALTMNGAALTRAIRHFERHEGVVLHPYLDTKGLVTVGVGFLCSDEQSFTSLPFERRGAGIAADTPEKRAAWTALREAAAEGLAGVRQASDWRDCTDLELPLSWVRERLSLEILERAEAAAGVIGEAHWHGLTDGQRLVATDIYYATGSLRGFPSFVEAARRQDGQRMAFESVYHSGRVGNGSVRRNWGRIVSNYALCLGLDPEDAEQRRDAATGVATMFARRGESSHLPAWLRLLVAAKKKDTGQ